jgi:hypothetical protein
MCVRVSGIIMMSESVQNTLLTWMNMAKLKSRWAYLSENTATKTACSSNGSTDSNTPMQDSVVHMNMYMCMWIYTQTYAFVHFNKVITAQYFIWYISLLSLALPSLLGVSSQSVCVCVLCTC